jgi:isocitrate lyase
MTPEELLTTEWRESPRWTGIQRPYTAAQVVKLRPSLNIEYSLARQGAEKLWHYMLEKPYVTALGALTGNHAVQQVQAGLDAVYLSGWQVAADANTSGHM